MKERVHTAARRTGSCVLQTARATTIGSHLQANRRSPAPCCPGRKLGSEPLDAVDVTRGVRALSTQDRTSSAMLLAQDLPSVIRVALQPVCNRETSDLRANSTGYCPCARSTESMCPVNKTGERVNDANAQCKVVCFHQRDEFVVGGSQPGGDQRWLSATGRNCRGDELPQHNTTDELPGDARTGTVRKQCILQGDDEGSPAESRLQIADAHHRAR